MMHRSWGCCTFHPLINLSSGDRVGRDGESERETKSRDESMRFDSSQQQSKTASRKLPLLECPHLDHHLYSLKGDQLNSPIPPLQIINRQLQLQLQLQLLQQQSQSRRKNWQRQTKLQGERHRKELHKENRQTLLLSLRKGKHQLEAKGKRVRTRDHNHQVVNTVKLRKEEEEREEIRINHLQTSLLLPLRTMSQTTLKPLHLN